MFLCRKGKTKKEVFMNQGSFHLQPIGYIRRIGSGIFLNILESFRPALKQLDHFSHVLVFWWADRHDNEKSRTILQTEPPYAKGILTGVFATRAEYRPNPISMTTCKLLEVDEEKGIVHIADIDAYDGTAIIDLKAYFPVCDRVKEAHIPDWLSDWPEWMPEEGLGL
jgi:tRNA-Thr(GGU) m(6)t(6)A37 methyltransferase TsaA